MDALMSRSLHYQSSEEIWKYRCAVEIVWICECFCTEVVTDWSAGRRSTQRHWSFMEW